jgi:hypothetical protein
MDTSLFHVRGLKISLELEVSAPGEPLTPLTPEEVRRAAEEGHVTPWDTSSGPYPPGVPSSLSDAIIFGVDNGQIGS